MEYPQELGCTQALAQFVEHALHKVEERELGQVEEHELPRSVLSAEQQERAL
jgi:hypothetical protein